MWKLSVLVFLGGGLGSVARFALAELLQPYRYSFPVATLLANIGSAVILGIVVFALQKQSISDTTYKLVAVGFCGGFSTFSTFTNESMRYLQNNAWTLLFSNILLNLFLCGVGLLFGLQLAKWCME
jgi:CrcB protein